MTAPHPGPGIYRGIPDEEYRAWPLPSQSTLKILAPKRGTPAEYAWRVAHPIEPTAVMKLGSLVDTLLLEPERTAERYIWSEPGAKAWPSKRCIKCGAAPLAPCRTKDGLIAQRCCDHRNDQPDEGKIRLVGWEELQAAQGCVSAVRQHTKARWLLDHSEHQVSFVWQEPESVVVVKGRLDLARLGEHTSFIGDLKSCGRGLASPRRWPKHAHDLGYHIQAALYHDAVQALTGEDLPWIWIAVETEAPYLCRVSQIAGSWLELGRREYRAALQVLAACQDSGEWGGYSPEIEIDEAPAWAGRDEA